MHALRTAILQHTTATGVHHDWLIEDRSRPDPKSPAARLWTARVNPPPQDWPKLKRFDLTVIPPHRRDYLTYQGQLTDNRGRVQQLATGTCLASLWSEQRIVLTLQTQQIQLDLQLTRQCPDHWISSVAQRGTDKRSKCTKVVSVA